MGQAPGDGRVAVGQAEQNTIDEIMTIKKQKAIDILKHLPGSRFVADCFEGPVFNAICVLIPGLKDGTEYGTWAYRNIQDVLAKAEKDKRR